MDNADMEEGHADSDYAQVPSGNTPDVSSEGDASAESAQDAIGRRRKNGLQKPWSIDMKLAILWHILGNAVFYAVCAWAFVSINHNGTDTSTELWTMLATQIFLVIAGMLCWSYCVWVDPAAEPRHTSALLRGGRWDRSRFCGVCRKTVPGLDHHCTWLNTCVGSKNFLPFMGLLILATTQFLLHILVCVFCVTLWRDDVVAHIHSLTVFWGLVIVCALLALVGISGYSSLLAFQLYLLGRGFGTYDFLLNRREQERAATARRAQRMQEERRRQSQEVTGPSSTTLRAL